MACRALEGSTKNCFAVVCAPIRAISDLASIVFSWNSLINCAGGEFVSGSNPVGFAEKVLDLPTNASTLGPSGQTTVATLCMNCTKSAAPTPQAAYFASKLIALLRIACKPLFSGRLISEKLSTRLPSAPPDLLVFDHAQHHGNRSERRSVRGHCKYRRRW
jgi:hypothetical protein